jgi:hypothetical protein
VEVLGLISAICDLFRNQLHFFRVQDLFRGQRLVVVLSSVLDQRPKSCEHRSCSQTPPSRPFEMYRDTWGRSEKGERRGAEKGDKEGVEEGGGGS